MFAVVLATAFVSNILGHSPHCIVFSLFVLAYFYCSHHPWARELRRDRNESTLHSLPLARFVHIKSLFDRQSNLWSGKEKSRKDTAIKKKQKQKESLVRGGETENWLLMKKGPQCVCVFFRRSIFKFIFFPDITKPATYSHSYTWVVLGRWPFSSAVYFRVHAVLNARSSEFRQILSRVLVTIMTPSTVYRLVLYLRHEFAPRIRCVRGMHVRYGTYWSAVCPRTSHHAVRKGIAYSRRAV